MAHGIVLQFRCGWYGFSVMVFRATWICCLTLLDFTLLYFALLYFALLYFTLLYLTWLCFALLYFALFCVALLYFTWLYFALLYFTLLCFTLLCFALPCFALHCFALLSEEPRLEGRRGTEAPRAPSRNRGSGGAHTREPVSGEPREGNHRPQN